MKERQRTEVMYDSAMPPSCIFCDNESGSEEHIWPAWLHRRRDFGPLRVQEGTGPEEVVDDPQRTINTVCHTCNNTWMSQLEQKNIPTLGTMVDNKPLMIDPGRQRLLREWSVKTAMINDSVKARHGNENFYTREERVKMRESRAIPDRTQVWIGQLDGSHLGIHGTDFTITRGGKTRLGEGSVTTIYMGYFVTQILTVHLRPEFTHLDIPVSPKPGDWSRKLIETWPTAKKKVFWPPAAPFTNGGIDGIAYLMDRWRMGEKVAAISAAKVRGLPE
jgi:hypothetical protein